jgi:metallo-beta-lactamase class B
MGTHNEHRESVQVFDQFYYIGVGNVNAWLVATSEGLIAIDALNNATDWTQVIEPAMHRFGLDPATIRTLIVTHGHGDHYGGARYLARTYHTRVLMSRADWALAQTPPDRTYFDPPPEHDLDINDGDVVSLGDTVVRLYLTPGHTPGTVSLLVPVTEYGRPHVVALWGGTGFNFTPSVERFAEYSASALRFRALARQANADVPLANHPDIDRLPAKLAQLKSDSVTETHPFVLGSDGVDHFLYALSECALAFRAHLQD